MAKVMMVGLLDRQAIEDIANEPVIVLRANDLGELRRAGALLYEQVDIEPTDVQSTGEDKT